MQRVHLRLPKELLKKLDELRKSELPILSRNSYIIKLLLKGIK
jgi:metal-responsive CopG/Arc/MetJ family transcriptional regulator